MAEGEEDLSKLAIEDRLSHKASQSRSAGRVSTTNNLTLILALLQSWKARLSAYTELTTLFKQTVDETDPAFRPYTNNPAGVREWVRDSNAVSQEKGVEAAVALVEWAGRSAARTRSEVVPSLVEKCLGSTRAGTKTKAIELCMLYVEVEEDLGEGVINDILPGLEVKQPKVVAGTVSVLASFIQSFGPKTVNPKPVLKILPKIFGHADKGVRAEGQALAVSLHSYLGPALTPHLSELKPVQQKELQELFDKKDAEGEGFGKLKQSRWTRTQQRERMVKETEGALEGNAPEDEGDQAAGSEAPDADEPPPDPYDFATPVDVLSSLPADFYTHLSSSKWKDRKDLALDPLLSVVKTTRIKPGSFSELVGALAEKVKGDANIVCVQLAAGCLEALAKGLRADFKSYWKPAGGLVLTRTKEKKASVLEALAAALDAMFLAISISDIVDEITTFSKDKNPSVKEQTLKFLSRSLSLTPSAPSKADLTALIDVCKSSLDDSTEPVRAAAAEAFGTLMKVVGERAMGGAVEALDDIRKTKVKAEWEKAVVKYRPGAAALPSRAAAAPPPAAPPSKPKPRAPAPVAVAASPKPPSSPQASPTFDSPATAPPKSSTGPPARLLAKKPPVASTSTAPPPVKKPTASTSSAKPPPAGPAKPSEPLKYKMSQDDADAQVDSVLPPAVVAEISDSNWKVRLAAIEALTTWLEGEGRATEAELVVRFLSKKPGWKESNFQVAGKMFGIFQYLAEKSPSFAKGSAALSIPALSDKLGDIKLKKPAGDALTAYAEKTSLGFVLGQAYEPMTKQKAPKAQADSLVWVEQAIREFGIAGLSIRDLIEFLKVGLKSSNAAVRTSATKTIVTLRIYVGDGISSFIQDLNPALLTTIEAEFGKVAGDSPPEPTRFSADNAVAAAAPGAGAKGKGVGPGGDPLDELFPRVELEKLITAATIAACNDANWKTRKEALETIQGVLEANKRLKPSNLSDLTTAMKLRMSDSNKVVQSLALDVIARIATGMGKPSDRIARILSGPVAGVLADAKINIRAAGIATLNAMADASGLESIIGGLDKPLDTPNPVLRKELLSFLEARFADPDAVTSLELTGLAGPIIACLEDKSAEVRKSAAALLPVIVARAGYGYVLDQTSRLKPASKSTVVPLIEAARGSAASISASAPAKGPTSAPAPSAPPASSLPSAGSRPTVGPARATAKVLRPPATAQPAVDDTSRPGSSGAIRPRPSIAAIRKPVASTSARSSPSPAPSSSTKTPPFRSADPDAKRVRAAKETGSLKWAVEGVARPDQVEALFQQMTPNTSPDLLAQLFSKDHSSERDFAAGLGVLDDCARDSVSSAASYDMLPEELRARLVANVDVIFKYITLRIGMTSTTITVKCLDLIDHLIPVLDTEGHKLSDYETSALMLSLINKVGDGKETIRQRVRVIFERICSVYPFSKVFATILEHGITSKNARTRAESADELGSLIQRHGVGPFPIPKALPQIAKLVSDRDTAVRTAALTAIGAAYTLIGADAVYKYVGAIPDKERTMLEERLKRTAGGTTATPSLAPRSATPVRPQQRSAASPPPSPSVSGTQQGAPSSSAAIPRASGLPPPKSKIGGLSRIGTGRPLSVVTQNAQSASNGSIPLPSSSSTPRKTSGSGLPTRHGIGRPPGSMLVPTPGSSLRPPRSRREDSDDESPPLSTSPEEVARIVHAIGTDDLARSTEMLKQIQREISLQPDFVVSNADDLMDAVAKQMPIGFGDLNDSSSPDTLRLCKHIMQTLTVFFDHKTLGQAVSTEALTMLLAELTGRLLDTAENPANEAIAAISKVLNMVLIRIFHNSDQTACFTAIFTVLHDAVVDLRELRGSELVERAKYAELVMKCLWKISKTVKESLEANALSATRLLRDIHAFTESIPPAEWRRRAADNIPLGDLPLRTVKTILQQIVSVYGEQTFDHLEDVDDAESSFVYAYLFRMANSDGASSNGRDSVASSLPLSRDPSTRSVAAEPLSRQRSTISINSDVSSPPLGRDSPVIRSSAASDALPAPPPSPGGSDIEVNQRLKAIFDMIGDPALSRQGIAELHKYQKLHPEAAPRINTWIAGTGTYFRTYLKRALDNLEAAATEHNGAAETSRLRTTSAAASLDRPSSSGSGTPSRPTSTLSVEGSRASARLSMGPGGMASPTATEKLEQLKSVFGA